MAKESRFERLKKHIMREYEEKGYSRERAEEIAAATAAKIGREKYGKRKFQAMAEAGRERHGG